jgi:hypothetical protein
MSKTTRSQYRTKDKNKEQKEAEARRNRDRRRREIREAMNWSNGYSSSS